MVRSIRIVGKFLWLGLMSGALALPLAAEEVTVTIPPDDPPAQAAPQPGASPSLPSFSAGNSAPKPVADSSDSTAHATDNASAPPPPAAPVKHKTKLKKAAPQRRLRQALRRKLLRPRPLHLRLLPTIRRSQPISPRRQRPLRASILRRAPAGRTARAFGSLPERTTPVKRRRRDAGPWQF